MIPEDIKYKHPKIEWKSMAGMRDKLIHHYFGVDFELVWDVVEYEIDELLFQVEKIINDLNDIQERNKNVRE